MEHHLKIGRSGEDLAVEYLIGIGFQLLHRNWRFRYWEIDVVASKNNVIHFIEVKTRTSDKYGYPEQNITSRKMHYLMNAAAEYLFLFPRWKRIQFDALAIILNGKAASYFFIEDIYP